MPLQQQNERKNESRNLFRAKNIEIKELEMPEVGDRDVLIQNIYSSICGTDVADCSVGEWIYPYPRYTKNDTARAGDNRWFSENILEQFMEIGKFESRFVSVAVNNAMRELDLLHMTYSQKSIIGSGGYMPEM